MRSCRKGRLALYALLASSSLTDPVAAQELPPLFRSPDENGVDVTLGRFDIAIPLGTIGTGDGALSLVEYGDGTDSLGISFRRVGSAGLATISIVRGNITDSYTGSPSATSFAPVKGDGSQLIKVAADQYKLIDADGAETIFAWPTGMDSQSTTGAFCEGATQTLCSLVAISTTHKSGKVVYYNWRSGENCYDYDRYGEPICAQYYRLSGVSNNLRYGISYRYESDADPTSGLPSSSWHKVIGAVFSNGNDSSQSFSVAIGRPSTSVFQYTDAANGVWQISRNAAGRIEGVKRPGSSENNVAVVYNSSGYVSQIIKDGIATGYDYIVNGTTATMTITRALLAPTVIVSDLNIGKPTRIVSGSGTSSAATTIYEYWPGTSLLKKATLPAGSSAEYTYDSRGNVTQTLLHDKTGNAANDITLTAGFSQDNKPLWTKDGKGNQTDYAYDPVHGEVTTVTLPAANNGVRPQTRYSYTPLAATGGSPIYKLTGISMCRTSADCGNGSDEGRTTIAYGAANLLPSSVTQASGDGAMAATSSYTYDAIGNLTSVDGPLAGTADTTNYTYDALRRTKSVVAPDPDGAGSGKRRAQLVNYLPSGLLDTASIGTTDAAGGNFAPAQQVAYQYDNARKVRTTVTAGTATYGVTQYSYDAAGRVECSVQRLDPAQWSGQADVCNPQVSGVYGPDRVTRVQYDEVGRVTSRFSGYGTAAQVEEKLTYTENGKVKTVADGKNNVTTYGYDDFDRAQTTTFADGSYEQYWYDKNGNVTSQRLRDGQSVTLGYDKLNRLVSTDVPNDVHGSFDRNYGYDNLGNLVQAEDTNGRILSFTYDALGRRTAQGDNWYGQGSASFQYDAAGRRTRLTWWDGNYVSYDYLVTGEVSAIRDGAGNALVTFGYDELGRRTSLSRANGTTTTYAFDAASRLQQLSQDLAGTTSDVTATFTYNPAGQITSRSSSNDAYAWTGHYNVDRAYGANSLNQITSAGTTAFLYDGRGNLTSSGSTTYSYTPDNHLALAAGIQLAHDPLGRLFNISNDGSVSTTLLYDGPDLLVERENNAGATLRRYVYGPGTDEPLIWYEGPGFGSRRWLHADERGSVVAVSDDAGNAIAINSYDDFGIPASTNVGRFQYTGQKWFPTLGLYDYKARMYSPTLGRFMQTDPIGYADGINWYSYVGNDPINKRDPRGLRACTEGEINSMLQTGEMKPGDIAVCGDSGGDDWWDDYWQQSFIDPESYLGEDNFSRVSDATNGEPRQQNEKKLSQCMIGFLGSQGYNTNGLGDVTFYNGSLTAQSVYNTMGNPAITIGNSIHVASSAWGRISSPSGGATYFEEIVHTRQYESWGMVEFGAAYGVASGMGAYNTGDAHNNPVENQAIALSNQLLRAYNNLPASKKCSD